MIVKKHLYLLLILLMLGAQIGLAQHATVHFTDHGHISHAEHHDHDDHGVHEEPDGNTAPETAELCQICIFAKSLSYSFAPEDITLPVTLTAHSDTPLLSQNCPSQESRHRYLARAPPAFLV